MVKKKNTVFNKDVYFHIEKKQFIQKREDNLYSEYCDFYDDSTTVIKEYDQKLTAANIKALRKITNKNIRKFAKVKKLFSRYSWETRHPKQSPLEIAGVV